MSLWVYLVPNRFAQLVALGRKARALNKHSKHSRDTILRWKWVCISLRLVPATVHENRGFSVPIPCACEGESPSTSGLLGVVPVSAPTIEGKKRKSIPAAADISCSGATFGLFWSPLCPVYDLDVQGQIVSCVQTQTNIQFQPLRSFLLLLLSHRCPIDTDPTYACNEHNAVGMAIRGVYMQLHRGR